MNEGEDGARSAASAGAGEVSRYFMDPWSDARPHWPGGPPSYERGASIRDRRSAYARPGSVTHCTVAESFAAQVDRLQRADAGFQCEAWKRRAAEFARMCRDLLSGEFDLSGEPSITGYVGGGRSRFTATHVTWPLLPVGGIVASTVDIPHSCGACRACAKAASERPTESWVYFIQAAEGGPVKIGYSARPHARAATLQSGSAGNLRVVALTPGGADEERMMHRLFARHRIRRRGEWFHPAPAILALIAELAEANPL